MSKKNFHNDELPWASVIPKEEIELYETAGFGRQGPLPKKAALVVIDVQYRSIGRVRAPIAESIEQYPTSCGEYGWRAVPHIVRLIQHFRENKRPVVFAYVAPKGTHDGQRFADKAPAIMSIPADGYELVEGCTAQEGDILLPKHHPSAFFGTPLVSYLVTQDVDGIVVAGTTTSGCVRATVVDGSSFGYHMVVPHDAVFDRSQTSHAVNLFDMHSKYASVMSTDEVLKII